MKMSSAEKKDMIASLQKHGFSEKEIQKVLKGLQQVEDGQVVSAEEVYRKLYAKMKVHV
jgi:Holliday junction resolvasome RuvABC DNA-binding subunit